MNDGEYDTGLLIWSSRHGNTDGGFSGGVPDELQMAE